MSELYVKDAYELPRLDRPTSCSRAERERVVRFVAGLSKLAVILVCLARHQFPRTGAAALNQVRGRVPLATRQPVRRPHGPPDESHSHGWGCCASTWAF